MPGIVDQNKLYGGLTEEIETFLGYRPTVEELEGFPFEIYKFIIRSIRDRDNDYKGGGTELLRRFLMGPQETWLAMYDRHTDIQDIFDPEKTDVDSLPGLRKYVGFGDDLLNVIAKASETELRRIIAGAIAFWKRRFQDSGTIAAVRLISGNRFKVRDYLDFRFIVGETGILEELEDQDSNIIDVRTRSLFKRGSSGQTNIDRFEDPVLGAVFSQDDVGAFVVISDDLGSPTNNGIYEIIAVDIPGLVVDIQLPFPRNASNLTWLLGFKNDEYLTEIRIVDTVSNPLNRPLLAEMLGVQRPFSERFNIVYIDFLDLFSLKGETSQWDDAGWLAAGTESVVFSVDNGYMEITEPSALAQSCLLSIDQDQATWTNYSFKTKAAIGGQILASIYFLYTDEDNYYRLVINYSLFGTGTLRIQKNTAGVLNWVGVVYPFPSLVPEVWWTYTIEVYRNITTGLTRIKVKLDNDLIMDLTDADHHTGHIGYSNLYSPLRISESEVIVYPVEIDRVGPNP